MRRPASILAPGLALLLATGCAHDSLTTANSEPPPRPSEAHYAHLFGQRYRTKLDLYLFEVVNDPEYHYLGRNGGNGRLGPKELPAAVAKENTGTVCKRWAEDSL